MPRSLNEYVLASPEVAEMMGRLGPSTALAHVAVFLAQHPTTIGDEIAFAEGVLSVKYGPATPDSPRTLEQWEFFRGVLCSSVHGSLGTVYHRWLGSLMGLTPTTARHGGINADCTTVEDIAPLHLSGPLAELARDRRVFGLGKYGVPLAAGHPDCRNGLRQEIGDCANYALGAGLERTHPDVFAQLTAALTATLAALDEQA